MEALAQPTVLGVPSPARLILEAVQGDPVGVGAMGVQVQLPVVLGVLALSILVWGHPVQLIQVSVAQALLTLAQALVDQALLIQAQLNRLVWEVLAAQWGDLWGPWVVLTVL